MRLTHASRIAIRPISICGCVDLRAVPSARAANSLLALPLFPLAVELCALSVRGVDHLRVRSARQAGKLPPVQRLEIRTRGSTTREYC